MRKIVFTIVGSMLISLCAVQAQENDTTGTASRSKTPQNKYKREQDRSDRNKSHKDQAWQQQSDRMNGNDQRALVIVDVQEIPSNIRQKLESDEKYTGWENATVYRNTNTGEYIIIPQPFRFDRQGNEKEMTGDQPWGYTNQRGQSAQQDHDMSGQKRERSQQDKSMSDQDQASQNDQSTNDQRESSSYRGEQDQSIEQQQPDEQQNSQRYRAEDDQYSTANMVEVQLEEIPESLRMTLQEREYEGWKEHGKMYRNPSASEYVLIIDKSDKAAQARRYRFDENGQRVNE